VGGERKRKRSGFEKKSPEPVQKGDTTQDVLRSLEVGGAEPCLKAKKQKGKGKCLQEREMRA